MRSIGKSGFSFQNLNLDFPIEREIRKRISPPRNPSSGWISIKKSKSGFLGFPFLSFDWEIPSSDTQGQSVGSGERAQRKFSVRAKEPLGTDPRRAISKNSRGCRLLIGHKKCFVLLCPIGEQFLLSSFREFVYDGYCFDHACLAHAPNSDQRTARNQETFSLI